MTKTIAALCLLILSISLSAQTLTGIWQTVDDTDGQAKAYIEIQEADHIFSASVIKLLPAADLTHCEACKGDKKNAPLVGLEILRAMKADGDEWKGGLILDPANGKEYKCIISFKDNNTLKVRGYIGTPWLGRTQLWYRVISQE